ncbi:MAG TPA: CRTAC1 family protein [Acidobacteriota bacterium]|nr:CRTAC1 family protein [Acidobacteriota bacterium]
MKNLLGYRAAAPLLSGPSAAGCVLALWLAFCGLAAGQSDKPLFQSIPPSQSGITWVHESARSEEHYLPETMSGGLAFLDYDQDGWMDLYMVNTGPSEFFTPTTPLSNALLRNQGDGTFRDVTAKAGVEARTFGMGAAVGDYDNDGYPDLYLTSHGRTILYRNKGDGTFEDVTEKAGVLVEGWTTSAAWFDYDNDGLLDLFVCNFVKFSKEHHISCGLNPLGKSFYCVPRVFEPTSGKLFRNNGDGTFSDAAEGTAIGEVKGKALGVVTADINNDRRLDIFVANDTVQDFLFINRGKNEWEEVGLFAGVGLSSEGSAQSGMGVDAADFDGDGWQELYVANIDHQYFSLFKNNRDESFQDLSISSPLGRSTFLLSGWGVRFFDFDHDGDLDLIQANGHPDDMIDEYASSVTYREPLLLFENRQGGLVDISDQAGPAFKHTYPARGLALGDYDNDGRSDAAIANIGEAPLLLRNQSQSGHHWVGLRLVGRTCNRDAVGAKVTYSVEGKARTRFLNGGGSYLSAHDPRLILGLGPADKVDWIEIRWPLPSDKVERLEEVPLDRYLTVEEGKGIVAPE